MNLEPVIKQHGKPHAGHHPEPQHNNFQHQLNGHFGLPVYQHLAVQNKSPRIQRYPFGLDHSAPKDPHHYHR